MKLSLADSKYLKDSISIVSELVNEARFKITSDGIKLVAMDPANVAMVVLKLFSSTFVEYDVKKETEIAINLSNLKQILKRAKSNDIVTLELKDENRLNIELKGNTKRTFSLPIIELEEKEQKIPDLKFPVTINTNSVILNEAIEDVDIVAESVSFNIKDGLFVVEASGDLSKANIEIKEDKETKIVAEGDNIKAKYSIEYLKKMITGSKIADKVKIQFNKDYPLKLEYTSVDKVMLSFILAPRVEE
ncbi:proliferating cell nuclear antigen (pcna) [Candidatus Woesearchaeota archaeon]|nr:proliferating cell nuclear antigen (pcna) [Candidatus Woesearchaeota archaeon]